ncbi:MAG: hypothetical protein HFJ64_04180 [Eggerthellaceae bacterium]|nr:hypothetical protein [Eggerthellaceae bacterium]
MAEGPNTSKSMETVDNPKNDGLTENAEQTEKTHISEGDAALSPADPHACSSAEDGEADGAKTSPEASESSEATKESEAAATAIANTPSPDAIDADVSVDKASESTAFKKKMRALIIAGVVIVLAALISGGVILANFFDENSLRQQMADKLSNDPIVSELTLTGEIFNESDFKVDDIQIDSLSHSMFSDKASANVLALIKNDCIQGYNRYELSFEKTSGAWELASAELRSADYVPYAPISDEIVLNHLPQLIAQVDSMNESIGYYPIDLANYYGEGTQAEIISNEASGYNDNISISISTDRDGVTLEGEFTIDLLWNTTKDKDPMWTTAYASATSDTYLQIGSILHEGVFSYANEADQADSRNQNVAWDQFFTHYLPDVRFGKSGKYALIGFENIPNNSVDMEFKITRDDTGEVIYQSERIAPNHCLDAIALATPLEAGTYPATITITSYEPGTDRLISMNSTLSEPITLTVSDLDLPF